MTNPTLSALLSRRLLQILVASWSLVSLAAWVPAQDWPTPGGPPGASRSVAMPMQSNELVSIGTIEAYGRASDTLVTDVDGDMIDEVLVVQGGRLASYSPDGTLEWRSLPAELSSIMPPIDLDGDGRPEVIALRSVAGFAIFAGTNGELLFRSDLEDLSKIGRILVSDLDGDKLPDLVAAELDTGSYTRGMGRTISYSLREPRAPRELFRLEENTRDYNNGNAIGLSDVDGNGVLEIFALGSNTLYVYSTVDGHLVESLHVGSIPYGMATAAVSDVDGDGDQEILFATNNPYGATVNSRRLFLVDADETGWLTLAWNISVADVSADAHSWPSPYVADLDDDGIQEAVHSFFDHTTSRWTTYVRTAMSGELVASMPGRATHMTFNGQVHELWISELATGTLAACVLQSGSLVASRRLDGDELLTELQGYGSDGLPTRVALSETSTGALFSLDNKDADGHRLAMQNVLKLAPDGTQLATRAVAADDYVASTVTAGGQVAVAVMGADGFISILDTNLALLNANGVGFPNVRTIETSLAPVVVAYDVGAGASIAGRADRLFDMSVLRPGAAAKSQALEVQLLGLVEGSQTGVHEWLCIDHKNRSEYPDLVALAADGSFSWSVDGVLEVSETSPIVYNRPSLSPDLNGDGVRDVLLQLRDPGSDQFVLRALSGASGVRLWPLDVTGSPLPSGAGPPLGLRHDSGPRVAFLHGAFSVHDGATGVELAQPTDRGAWWASADTLDGTNDVLFLTSGVEARWRAFTGDGSLLWRQEALYVPGQRYSGSGASIIHGPTTTYLAEGRSANVPFDHNLAVLDATTGTILHKVTLDQGSVHAAQGTATTGVRAGVGLDGTEPRYLVGASDGFLYLLDPSADSAAPNYPANLLITAWDMGSPCGDASAADLDNDGFVEVLIPTVDGPIHIMDAPTIDAHLVVADTDCMAVDIDVDSVEMTDRFCASWSGTNAAHDGFVAILVDSDTHATVAGPLEVHDTLAEFVGLHLTLGRTYHVEVQAYAGAGPSARASRVFMSDGAVAIDHQTPPLVSLSVVPGSIVPGAESATITAVFTDQSGLAAFRVSIRGESGEVFVLGGPLNATSHTAEFAWDGVQDGALPLGLYEVFAEGTDFGGLVGLDRAPLMLVAEPPPDVTEDGREDVTSDVDQAEPLDELVADEPSDLRPVEGESDIVEPTTSSEESVRADCACQGLRSQPRPHSGHGWLGLGAIGLLLLNTRRGRSREAPEDAQRQTSK